MPRVDCYHEKCLFNEKRRCKKQVVKLYSNEYIFERKRKNVVVCGSRRDGPKTKARDPATILLHLQQVLKFSDFVLNRALRIMNEVQKLKLDQARHPMTYPAAAVYVAGIMEGERFTQRAITDSIGLSDGVIRFPYKTIIRHLGPEVVA